MMIIQIGVEQIDLLHRFVSVLGSSGSSFRYFQTRSPEVITGHVVTLLGIDDAGMPVCYGHLDREDNIIWLGIAVAEGHTGQGLGNHMMTSLLREAESASLNEIRLAVDNANLPAIRLYENHGFQLFSRNEKIRFYLKKLRHADRSGCDQRSDAIG